MAGCPSYMENLILTISKETSAILANSNMEIQALLSVIAIVLALLTSLLTHKVIKRKILPLNKNYTVLEALKELLPPTFMVMALIAAGWASVPLLPPKQPHTIIANITKLAFLWFVARILLLITQRHFMAYFLSIVMLGLTLLSVTGLFEPIRESLKEIAFETETFHLSMFDAIKGIFTMIMLFWGAGVLSKTCESWIRKLNLSFNARELSIKFLRVILYIVAIIITLNSMGVDLTALTVFGGALAVGLGFGLQRIASNFISGIVLLFERAIEAGDLIEVGNEKGWVRQMAIRHTLIETFDGREILVPNEELVTNKVTNWTYTNTRARIDINLTIEFNSDVELAQKLLIAAAKNYKHCISTPAPAANLREFNERGIHIMLIFWIPDITEGAAIVKSTVMLEIIKSFRQAGINFAKATG